MTMSNKKSAIMILIFSYDFAHKLSCCNNVEIMLKQLDHIPFAAKNRLRGNLRFTRSRGSTEKVVEFVPNIYDPLINPNDKTYYNPNHGYEPYWPQGEWLIQDPDEGTNKSTTKIPTVCGEECNYLYMKIGPVCAHRSDNVFWEGCWYLVETFAFGYCDGHRLDDRMKGYTTFDTYCQYLDAKCKAPENTKYGLVHFGKCLEDQNLIYKKVHAASDVMSRMSGYLASLKVAMQNLNVDIV